MDKPRCLQDNHLIIVIYLGAFWVGSETHLSCCCVVWSKPQQGGGPSGPGCACKMRWRCTEGQAHGLESAGDQGRLSLVPGAGWAAGMGWEGGDRDCCQWDHWRGRGRVVLQAVPASLCARFGVHVLRTGPSQRLCGWGSRAGLGCSWGSSGDGSGGDEHFREGWEDAALQSPA